MVVPVALLLTIWLLPFDQRIQLLRLGLLVPPVSPKLYIPPPLVAELPLSVLLLRFGLELLLYIPPPWFDAEFPLSVQLVRLGLLVPPLMPLS